MGSLSVTKLDDIPQHRTIPGPSQQIPNVAQFTLTHLGLPVLTKLWQHHVKMLLRERKQFTAKLSGNKSV